jgi:hypothetical protein
MQEQSFLSKNLTLVVGISLPLLLVLVFWVAMAVPRLYYFESATGNLREISVDLPEKPDDGAVIAIAELAGRTLVAKTTAPDGYRFDNSYRGSRGFLFFFDGYRYGAKIEKDGRAEKIPAIDGNNYFASYEFIG